MLLLFAILANAQARKRSERDTEQWRYELECAGTGSDGTYLIKVWSYSKRGVVAIEQAKKNAVHGVVFKGFTGNGRECITQRAITSDPNIENTQAQFFESFFADGGKYMKFVNISSDGNIDANDRMKVGKEYKIGIVVSVMKDALRNELESAGVIRGLSTGF